MTFEPERLLMSMISARLSLSSSSATRPSMKPCRSRAAWYSAFSERSPCSRAAAIALMTAGRSTVFRRFSSAVSRTWPSGVIGILFVISGRYPQAKMAENAIAPRGEGDGAINTGR